MCSVYRQRKEMQKSWMTELPFWTNTPSEVIELVCGAENAVTMTVCSNNHLMFALFSSIHRSHNTAGDRKTRERLFEGANSPLDTGQTTRCKTLSISCDRLLRVCDCSLLLSVVGSKCRVHLLSTLSACSVKLAAPARATEDRTPSRSHRRFLPHWKSSVWNC